MRIAIALSCMAGLASAQTHPALRLVPFASVEHASEGGGMNGDWTIASGTRFGVGGQATLWIPKEDSMGWAIAAEAGLGSFSGDLEGTRKVPDGSPSGSSSSASSYQARIQSGPFYRMLGLWGSTGGVFGANWEFTESDPGWYREDYALFFGLYSEAGTDPWARQGVRGGAMLGRLGGDERWEAIYGQGVISDSLEWLREGFEGQAQVECWRGPVWAQVVVHAASTDLRHRSEEGSRGKGTDWSLGLRVGYRFGMGDLEGFR